MRKVHNFLHFYVSALDANKRFVYGQAYLQADWLKFQVFRPSDKSREMCVIGPHLRNNFLDEIRTTYDARETAFKNSIDFWKVYPCSGMSTVTHYASSLESSSDMSELERFLGCPEESDSD
jgi:hypothetical protein